MIKPMKFRKTVLDSNLLDTEDYWLYLSYPKGPVEAMMVGDKSYQSYMSVVRWLKAKSRMLRLDYLDQSNSAFAIDADDGSIWVSTLMDGPKRVNLGDWIIIGESGVIYLCKSVLFSKAYDEITNDEKDEDVVEDEVQTEENMQSDIVVITRYDLTITIEDVDLKEISRILMVLDHGGISTNDIFITQKEH